MTKKQDYIFESYPAMVDWATGLILQRLIAGKLKEGVWEVLSTVTGNQHRLIKKND